MCILLRIGLRVLLLCVLRGSLLVLSLLRHLLVLRLLRCLLVLRRIALLIRDLLSSLRLLVLRLLRRLLVRLLRVGLSLLLRGAGRLLRIARLVWGGSLTGHGASLKGLPYLLQV